MEREVIADVTAIYNNSVDKDGRNTKRRKTNTEKEAVKEVFFKTCCQQKCLNSFSMEEIEDLRNFYWNMSPKQRRAFIYSSIKLCSVGGVVDKFTVEERKMCETGWRDLYGVKDRRYREIKKRVRDNESLTTNVPRINNPSRRSLQADTWLDKYIRNFGERQPDREEVHLPKCLSKETVYGIYVKEMERSKEPILSISGFRDLWLKNFSHVKICTGKSGQPTCTPCTNFKSLLMTNLGKELRNRTLAQLNDHLNLQSLCRGKYYKHIKKSRENPSSYVSIIIDNMDQAKTRLPRFAVPSKSDAHLARMQHHITGVKVHSINRTFIYTWTDLFHPDANITINCLVHALNEVCKENDGKMPPTLYIQADNSCKDNKNGFVMMFLAWLIKKRVFKKVKMNFLMVGHTHEDIDQVFSRVATHMGRNDAHTLTELLNCITKSTTPEPDVVHLKSIFDYKEVLMNARGLIEGITGPHVFRFAEEDGNIIMAYKDWPTSEEVYRKLNVSNCVISSLAHLENTKCNPKIEETLARMSNDISKWAESGRLEKEEVLWWKAYLSSCKQEVRLRPEVPRATVLGTFLCHAPPLATGMDNLRLAVEKNVSKEKRTSLLRLKRR